MGNLNFDASEVAPMTDTFTPIPAGHYQMRIIEAGMQLGKKADAGEMLKLQFEVDAEAHMKYAGRRVFSYLCINHKGNTARNIARRQLSAICQAIGEKVLDDTEQLLGQLLLVTVKVSPAVDGYEASNDATGYAAPDSDADSAPGPSIKQLFTDAPSADNAQPAPPAEEPVSGAAKRAWK